MARAAVVLGSQQWVIDGEALGDHFVAFDLLESACTDLRPRSYAKRLAILAALISVVSGPAIRLIETATNKAAKKALFARLTAEKAEGIVLKRHAAPYTVGRPNSGGDPLKWKFVTTASCIVADANGEKRSIRLELMDGDQRVPVGNVTVPANQPIPTAGMIVEARYLYAHVGGSLYQPVLPGVRKDLTEADCTISQLKFKPTSE